LQPPADVECPICRDSKPAVDIKSLSCCGFKWCKSCCKKTNYSDQTDAEIDSNAPKTKRCPHCRQPYFIQEHGKRGHFITERTSTPVLASSTSSASLPSVALVSAPTDLSDFATTSSDEDSSDDVVDDETVAMPERRRRGATVVQTPVVALNVILKYVKTCGNGLQYFDPVCGSVGTVYDSLQANSLALYEFSGSAADYVRNDIDAPYIFDSKSFAVCTPPSSLRREFLDAVFKDARHFCFLLPVSMLMDSEFSGLFSAYNVGFIFMSPPVKVARADMMWVFNSSDPRRVYFERTDV